MIAAVAAPPRCRLCRSAPPDSEEHLFQSALGGRRRIRGVLCKPCNERLGATIDADMIESLAGVRMLLAIEGDRGQTASVRAMSEDGVPILLRPGARPKLLPAKPNLEVAGDLMKIASNSEDQAIQVTAAHQRKRREQTLTVRDVKVTKWFPGKSKFDLNLDVGKFSRPAVKTALTLLTDLGHESADAFAAAWRFVGGAPASDCGVRSHFSSTLAPWEERALGPVPHRITVRSDPASRSLYADVRYFGDIAFCFHIDSPLVAPFEGGYGVDPFSGQDRLWTEPLGAIELPGSATSDAIHDAVERALRRIITASGPRQVAALVEHVTEECSQKILGGKRGPPSDDELEAISSCVQEQIAFIARRETAVEDDPDLLAALQVAADKARNGGR